MSHSKPTRGSGLLEPLLARKRSDRARRLLDLTGDETILDIGCGSDPLFLKSISVTARVGVERSPSPVTGPIALVGWDAGGGHALPFKDASFDAVTMLAVLEHLPAAAVPNLFVEIHRVLKEGAAFVLTTPPPRTDALLGIFARLRLVSREEIEEHAQAYRSRDLQTLFEQSPFGGDSVRIGTFELGMNLWAHAKKTRSVDGTV